MQLDGSYSIKDMLWNIIFKVLLKSTEQAKLQLAGIENKLMRHPKYFDQDLVELLHRNRFELLLK